MMKPGKLETRHLRLSPLAPGDAAAFLQQWNDLDVGRFLWDGNPVARETVEAVIQASERSFAEQGYGLWTLREAGAAQTPAPNTDPGVLGFCGLRVPDGQPDPELLYALEPRAWGRGLAREAALEVIRHAFATLGLPRVTAAANPANPASWKVLERVGLRRTGVVHTKLEDLYTYEVTREEFLAACAHPKDPAC